MHSTFARAHCGRPVRPVGSNNASLHIGEYTSHLSKELKALHPEIPWSKVAGLRHRLVHDYEGTNWHIVIRVIFENLPAFIKQVRTLLPENSS